MQPTNSQPSIPSTSSVNSSIDNQINALFGRAQMLLPTQNAIDAFFRRNTTSSSGTTPVFPQPTPTPASSSLEGNASQPPLKKRAVTPLPSSSSSPAHIGTKRSVRFADLEGALNERPDRQSARSRRKTPVVPTFQTDDVYGDLASSERFTTAKLVADNKKYDFIMLAYGFSGIPNPADSAPPQINPNPPETGNVPPPPEEMMAPPADVATDNSEENQSDVEVEDVAMPDRIDIPAPGNSLWMQVSAELENDPTLKEFIARVPQDINDQEKIDYLHQDLIEGLDAALIIDLNTEYREYLNSWRAPDSQPVATLIFFTALANRLKDVCLMNFWEGLRAFICTHHSNEIQSHPEYQLPKLSSSEEVREWLKKCFTKPTPLPDFLFSTEHVCSDAVIESSVESWIETFPQGQDKKRLVASKNWIIGQLKEFQKSLKTLKECEEILTAVKESEKNLETEKGFLNKPETIQEIEKKLETIKRFKDKPEAAKEISESLKIVESIKALKLRLETYLTSVWEKEMPPRLLLSKYTPELKLENLNLPILPEEIQFMDQLVILSITNCNVKAVPSSLQNMKILRQLNLSNNQLRGKPSLPIPLSLETLLLDNNLIESLDISDTRLQLTHLSAANCKIKKIKTSLKKLSRLNLSRNQLEGTFILSPFVETLILDHNEIQGLALSSDRSPQLTHLSAVNCKLEAFPNILSIKLSHLRELNLSHNCLKGVFSAPFYIETLVINDNEIERIEIIRGARDALPLQYKMKKFSANNNKLIHIDFVQLTDKLEYFSAENNQLIDFNVFCFFPRDQLKFISLKNNKIESFLTIDDPIERFRKVGGIYFREELSLSNLEVLKLSGNPLKYNFWKLGCLDKLKTLELEGIVFSEENAHILNLLYQLNNQSKCRLLVDHESNVLRAQFVPKDENKQDEPGKPSLTSHETILRSIVKEGEIEERVVIRLLAEFKKYFSETEWNDKTTLVCKEMSAAEKFLNQAEMYFPAFANTFLFSTSYASNVDILNVFFQSKANVESDEFQLAENAVIQMTNKLREDRQAMIRLLTEIRKSFTALDWEIVIKKVQKTSSSKESLSIKRLSDEATESFFPSSSPPNMNPSS